jgi:hypothetical protein
MDDERHFHLWTVSPADLENMDLIKARNLMVRCFYEAQKDTFARARIRLKKTANEGEVLSSVTNMIQLIFKTRGYDFDNPTKNGLRAIAEELIKKAAAWGTPAEVWENNQKQFYEIVARL